MKQILQNLKSGKTELVEIPISAENPYHLLIRTTKSLLSAGTERMLVEFGKAGYIAKARSQPDKIRQVLDKIKTDGFVPTVRAVGAKLDQPLPLGYCSVGVVQRSAAGGQFSEGDTVVSNGPHAEYVSVPLSLCAKIPESVTDEEAAFVVLGAIGLQGIRLAQPTLGEAFVVTGLGLIGQFTVQLLIAHGCRVLGIDIDGAKCELARKFGAQAVDLSKGENPVEAAKVFSRARGVDGVLITAATKSSEPVHQAAQMCRKRGRIVLVGVTGLELSRADFYEKELSFQVSCSYGPGRYDPDYEEKGHDYPIGYVRWTEQRNFEAVLDLMARGKIDVKPMISHRFPFEEAEKAYELISGNKEPYLGIILDYRRSEVRDQKSGSDPQITQISQIDSRTIALKEPPRPSNLEPRSCIIGAIGAGNFTGQVLLPAIQKTSARLKVIASSKGVTGTHLGKKFGFEQSTTDAESVLADPEVNTVFITTRHNTHASFVIEALKAGKHVFVEKPLCLTIDELNEITKVYSDRCLLMVGFNRRFAPHIVKMKSLLDGIKEPKSMIMTVNAGAIPREHWTQDPEVGGGRIIGEACHFVDLLRYLAGSPISESGLVEMNGGTKDTVTISLTFRDGSIGTVHYFANGSKTFPKERIEVFASGKILQMDNFKSLTGYGWKGFRKMNLWSQDKGHGAEVQAFVNAITNGPPCPIGFGEIVEVTQTTINLATGVGRG